MDNASFVDVFIAVITANGVTAWVIYCLIRMSRTDNDHKANLSFLALLAFIGAILYASTTS